MPTISPPFPASDAVIWTVRSSCKALREASKIGVSSEAIDSLLRGLDRATFERLKGEHGVSFPLTFDTVHVEVNFLAVLALLNTLSAYRAVFHRHTGSGAYQNVLRLMMALYLSSGESGGTGKLSAQGLASLSEDEVAQIWGVSLMTERPHESLPVTVGERGGEMLEVVELVVGLCNETGRVLQQGGYPDLGAFALEALREGERVAASKGDAAGMDAIIDKLVRGIPGFADMRLVDGAQPVYVFKKAFFFVYSIAARFTPERLRIRVPPLDALPMFVDNVIPTMLKHLGVVDLSQSTSAALRQWHAAERAADAQDVEAGPELGHDDAYRVRAAALDAGAAIAARANELAQQDAALAWMAGMNEADVDGYLWAVAKDDKQLRKVPRLVERRTVMY